MKKRREQYHMTEKEMVRLKVAEILIEDQMKVKQAARILNIFTSNRIEERVKRIGPKAAILKGKINSIVNGHENSIV